MTEAGGHAEDPADVHGAPDVGELLRELAPQVLGALMRRYGEFGECEDAVQEALLKAVTAWPERGVPQNPTGWLLTVASRRLIDEVRSESARRRREELHTSATAPLEQPREPELDRDDSLKLLFLCCHPALSAPSQIALTLRAVGGLSTAQIAAAFLVPEATMAQRISRAKQTVKSAGARFELPGAAEYQARLGIVLQVLYLIFNEGYTATTGTSLTAPELSAEAIRLTRRLHRLALDPRDPEITGLLALMLLTDARRAARTGSDGSLIPLTEQDRDLWDRERIAEGVALLNAALPVGPVGPYQVQAAIGAVHDEAPSVQETDWPQILGLYELLERLAPGPMVSLNRAVALAMVEGPAAGLELLRVLESDRQLADHHRLHATRAHLLEMSGDLPAAAIEYELAARRTTSQPERQYLIKRSLINRSPTDASLTNDSLTNRAAGLAERDDGQKKSSAGM